MANFVSLQTGLTGIRAAQAGIDVTSHNVANANTPGYTRQRTVQQARAPYDSAFGPIGTGVDIEQIERMRDSFLDTRVRTTSADAAFDGTRAELLTRAEGVTGEPDAGIAVELDHLWATFEDLANDPNEAAARTQVLDALETLTARVNNVAGAWDDLAADTRSRRDAAIDELNGLVGQVADIDRQVRGLGDQPAPADLLDRRDAAIDRIAEATGARALRQPEGHVVIELQDGTTVLDVSASEQRAFGADATNDGITLNGAAVTVSGELGGITQFLTTDLDAQQTELDAFAANLANELNSRHALGFTPGGVAGAALLGPAPTPDAAGLTVEITDPDQLAAGGASGAPHDGDNAQALADLRWDGGITDDYRELVVGLGAEVAGARRAAEAKSELGHAAEQARVSMHGVSIDEEMVNLIHYQRGLEAASRVMTTVDQALDVLINRTGIVGR